MKVKAVVDGDTLKLKEHLTFKTKEFEISIPDEYLQTEEETEGGTFLRSLWETIGEFPGRNRDLKGEWRKHLEERYG